MSRSKSCFARNSTAASQIATHIKRMDSTTHVGRCLSGGSSLTQHSRGADNIANARPVDSPPKKRPMNNTPYKLTIPSPSNADACQSADLTRQVHTRRIPTAIANTQAVTDRLGTSPLAFLVVPMVGAFFIDLANALVIKLFLLLPLH